MDLAPVYVSKEGLEKMKEELHYLKTVKRRECAARIEKAKDLGDLKENADYHDAKDESGWTEGRIRELEDATNRATVIETRGSDNVGIGCKVKVEGNGKEKLYTIVGSHEADPLKGLISNDSPLGQAFLGKRVGETAEVKTPAGTVTYVIKEISC